MAKQYEMLIDGFYTRRGKLTEKGDKVYESQLSDIASLEKRGIVKEVSEKKAEAEAKAEAEDKPKTKTDKK